MMNGLKTYLQENASQSRAEAMRLDQDDRQDEAKLAKIRANVYDIFASVLQVAAGQTDPEGFFRDRLQSIPANWAKALEKAQAHDETDAIWIEQTKLDTASKIQAYLNKEA